jgi:DNA-binding transcriptional regulator/RsmH inhibitor MraZ|tara:strand:+ start:9938 stop:10099 length:162 start_codon:yes stop_codon:yes gene_type:complete
MNIAKVKIDKRGRINLPLQFLKANNIIPEKVVVTIKPTNSDFIKLYFDKKEDE